MKFPSYLTKFLHNLPRTSLENLPAGLSESAVTRLMQEREPRLSPGGNFIGAGAYEHHIPAAVWEITSRGEFYNGLYSIPGRSQPGHFTAYL